MLSNQEITHCSAILSLLETNALYSLKDTITKGLIVAQTREEAINVILEHSNSVIELLSRKKLTKDVVLKYLMGKGVPVDLTSSKEVLVHSIIEYINNGVKTSVSCSISPLRNVPSSLSTQELSSNVYRQQVASDVAVSNQQIAKEFVAWFYPMLNSLSGGSFSPASEWTEKHFWPDCVFNYQLTDHEKSVTERHEGASVVTERLRSLVTDFNFVFNANDTPNGYRGQITTHGLAEVGACGTIHRMAAKNSSPPCAIFEQAFGLMRDPSEDNRWKIKFTNLSVKSK